MTYFARYLIAAALVVGGVACGGKGKAPATAQDKAQNGEMKKTEAGGATYGGAASGSVTPANPCAGN